MLNSTAIITTSAAVYLAGSAVLFGDVILSDDLTAKIGVLITVIGSLITASWFLSARMQKTDSSIKSLDDRMERMERKIDRIETSFEKE